jgi:EAL domain-containing protein (putative c-di-GMP-specific phosphodiesterase class I)
MGLSVTAEGVERQEKLQYLTHYGCNKIQGYLSSRPVPETEAIKLFHQLLDK